jgi:hypothetical protein
VCVRGGGGGCVCIFLYLGVWLGGGRSEGGCMLGGMCVHGCGGDDRDDRLGAGRPTEGVWVQRQSQNAGADVGE